MYGGTGPGGWLGIVGGLLLASVFAFEYSPVKTPVFMLHSVVGFRADRPRTFSVWCAPHQFEGYLAYLKRKGYETVTLGQLHAHLSEGVPLPKKPVVLTFDDGYLDNWVYAAPLLERYGFTGTVFVPADFVEDGDTPRATLRDVWEGRISEDALDAFGYMNRAELRAAAESGVLDIQSHGRTHTWLPTSTKIKTFHHPGIKLRELRWMWWNRNVARKPRWFQEIDENDIPWGAPVYENHLALSRKAVEPDPGLEERLVAHVAEAGGTAFFERASWKEELLALAEEHRAEHPPEAEPESDAAFRARLIEELRGSREALEAITGREVRFMCWPNGGTCPEAFALLEECGYLAATLPSRMKQPQNYQGTNPAHIGRLSGSSYFRGSRKRWPWVLSFALKIERNRGNRLMEIPIKAIWLYRRFVRPSGGRPPGAEEES